MTEVYDQFLTKAWRGRTANGVKMDRAKLLTLAGGRIWTGRQAKEAGLVDALGTFNDAIAEAKSLAKLSPTEEVEFLVLPEPTNPLDKLLEGGIGLKGPGSDLVSLLKGVPEARTQLRAAESLLKMRTDRAWLMLPYGVRVK